MTLFNKSQHSLQDDDLICPVCSIPLLNRNTPCPKCGSKIGQTNQPQPITQTEANDTFPPTRSVGLPKSISQGSGNPGQDDIFTTSLIFVSGMGVIFALLNLFISGFGLDDIWRSFVAIALSLILLGFRRVILK
jgi:hypothetical protein